MATKTFSSRADSAKLAYADAVTRSQFGMSFGQYCGSVLVEAISQGVPLPTVPGESAQERKANAAAKIKSIAQRPHDASIGRMSDAQIKELLGSRYD